MCYAFFSSEVQFCGKIAMNIPAYSFADKTLGDSKTLRKLPHLAAALCYRIIQSIHRDQRLDGPFIRAVFVDTAVIHSSL